MLLEISRLPKRYWTCSFATATSTLENQAAIEKVKVYAENFTGRGGVVLLGPGGTGKTHMVACMIDSLTSRGIRALFGNVLDLLGRLRRSYDDGAQEEEWRIIDELASAPLLVIDDLGKEKVSGWVEQTLYRIVDMRYRENRALVVTSNFTLSELEKRYNDVGSALISRIAEMCEGVRLGGKDWRRS
jgi:DNA replication protein DnaC